MPVIEVKGLTYSYQSAERPVLRDISFAVERGEFVIITGPSGCGKTTLCRCFNGLIPHFYGGTMSGEVLVAGLSVKERSISELAQHVGMVFQSPENQLFALSVEKDVAFGLENLAISREEMRQRVDWALEMTGISDLRVKAPYELSGGQQQRVAIASVLAMRPEIMVLDEPTSFLDPASARRIFEVVSGLNRALGLTVVLIEHRLDLATTYASRVIVMDGGEVKLNGDPSSVYSAREVQLLGIGIPKSVRLYQVLKEKGFDLNRPPLTAHEAATMIRTMIAR